MVVQGVPLNPTTILGLWDCNWHDKFLWEQDNTLETRDEAEDKGDELSNAELYTKGLMEVDTEIEFTKYMK